VTEYQVRSLWFPAMEKFIKKEKTIMPSMYATVDLYSHAKRSMRTCIETCSDFRGVS